jgi:hypothetical protein
MTTRTKIPIPRRQEIIAAVRDAAWNLTEVIGGRCG